MVTRFPIEVKVLNAVTHFEGTQVKRICLDNSTRVEAHQFIFGQGELNPIHVCVTSGNLDAQNVLALFDFRGLAVHIAVGIPVFAGGDGDSIGYGVAIDIQHKGTAGKSTGHMGTEQEFGGSHHINREFKPFASIGITDSEAFAVFGIERIAAAKAYHVHAVFAIDLALVLGIVIRI